MKERYKRQSFLGPDSERILRGTIAAIIGLGGGGSHIAQQLAHLGVGNFVAIDPDKVEESNLNRLVGATYRDAKKATRKTAVAKRMIASINPEARITPVKTHWQKAHEILRGCDVIFGCLDSYRERAELEVAARRYLVPYVDIGMDVHQIGNAFSVSGQVILSMPGELCMRCMGFIRDDLLAREAEKYGAAGGRPQVVWTNGILASAAVGLFTQLFTPWQGLIAPCPYLELDADTLTLRPSNRLQHLSGSKCPHFADRSGTGDPFWKPQKVPAE